MKTLHIAPSDSAGGSLKRAIQDAGLDDEVLPFRDDLSCGPIDSDNAAARVAWWDQFYEDATIDAVLGRFWERVTTADERLVVWFARHRASELAFYHAWSDRLGDRPYQCIDVTDLRFPRRDGNGMGEPIQSVAIMQPDMLRSRLGSEKAPTPERRMEAIRRWRKLKVENAPFRIVTDDGLASAPIDCFDHLLLGRSSTGWQRVLRLVGSVMGHDSDPYMQVGDTMLRSRVAALVCEGKLLADGDPWDRACQVRLPD